MQVRVRLYGPLKKYAQSDDFRLEMPDGARVSDLLDRLKVEDREWLVVLSNRFRVGLDEPLADGSEVGLMVPLGGG